MAQKTKKQELISILPYCLFLMLFWGCGNKYHYQKYHALNNQWKSSDDLQFELHISDNSSPYQLFIDIRHLNTYPYQNFWTFTTTKTPKNEYFRDTIPLYLADNKGKWLGRSSSGNIISHHILFKKDFFFQDTGTYVFTFEQGLRDSIAPISDFGFSVTKGKLDL